MARFLLPSFVLVASVCAAMAAPDAAASAAGRPNIVVILVDDMGYSDIGCYGGEIPTPHLDALAANGLRFTHFHNTGRCCPTRASLLTGLYSHQAGIGHMTRDYGVPGYRGRLNNRCVTIAEALGAAGYFTAMTGKWHVGQNHGVTPRNRGFRRSLNLSAGGTHFSNQTGIRERTKLYLDGEKCARDDPRFSPPWYAADLWTDWGIRFIDEALADDRPFFLYLAHTAPHFPCMAPEATIANYRGKFMEGWDNLRDARHRRQIEGKLVDPQWRLPERPEEIPAWESLPEAGRNRYDDMMAIYAAMIDEIDKNVGKLVAALRDRGVLDNTLILFLSDNGGNSESGVPGKYEGEHPGDPHSNVFVGRCWAHLSNTPFRRYKHHAHEGGTATPLIAHWPAGIDFDDLDDFGESANDPRPFTLDAPGGPLCHAPAHVIDIMATCVDLAGANYPESNGGHAIQPMEGISLRPTFAGDTLPARSLYFEHEGNAAVVRRDLKLVRFGGNGPWELYDMIADRTETRDLAAQRPEDTARLAADWSAWAKRANVRPDGLPQKPKRAKHPQRRAPR